MRVIYIGSKGSPNKTRAFGYPMVKGRATDLPDDIAKRLGGNPSFHVGDGGLPVVGTGEDEGGETRKKDLPPDFSEEVARLDAEIDRLAKVNIGLQSQHKTELEGWSAAHMTLSKGVEDLKADKAGLKQAATEKLTAWEADYKDLSDQIDTLTAENKALKAENTALKKPKTTPKPAGKK